MIRRYCDICETEIEHSYAEPERLKGEHRFRSHDGHRPLIAVEVVASIDGVKTDICRDCVIDAVMALDTRPQVVDRTDG